jgi:hypothetical protein
MQGKCHACGEFFAIHFRCEADERKQDEAASLETPDSENMPRDDPSGASTTDKVPFE